MFPTNNERLIGVSDAFSAFVYGYPSSCPRAHCTLNKSVPTLRYTLAFMFLNVHGGENTTPAGLDLYIQAMPVGTTECSPLDFRRSFIGYATEWTLIPIFTHLPAPLERFGYQQDCENNTASNHSRKHECRPPSEKKQTKTKKFHLV